MAGIAIGALARPKALALISLAVISFVAPLAERWGTGRVDPFSSYGLAEMALSLVILFWWYHLDKAEHAYPAGKLMNAGVLVLAVVALPVYFIRSRGWQRGTRTIALALVFLGLTLVLGEAGERLGAWLDRGGAVIAARDAASGAASRPGARGAGRRHRRSAAR